MHCAIWRVSINLRHLGESQNFFRAHFLTWTISFPFSLEPLSCPRYFLSIRLTIMAIAIVEDNIHPCHYDMCTYRWIYNFQTFTQKFNFSYSQFTMSVFTYLLMQDCPGPLIITSYMTWWQFSHWLCSLRVLPFQNLLKEGRRPWIMMKTGKTKRNHYYQTQIRS